MTVMVTVILGILKVIGILLLIILGLLLCILLCALFVPVRYRVQGQRSAEVPLQGQVTVSWLLHLFGICVDAKETDISIKLRIFGIPLDSLREFLSRRKKKKRAKARKKAAVAKKKDTKHVKQEVPRQLPDRKPTEEAVPVKTSEPTEKKSTATVQKAEKIQENVSEKAAEPQTEKLPKKEEPVKQPQNAATEQEKSGENRLVRFFKRLWQLPGRILKKVQQVLKSAEHTKKSLGTLKAFIDRQETKGALRLVWKKAVRLGRHILPRKLKGYFSYGFSDPADTGYLLALLGALYPVYGDHVKVEPDFQQKKLEFSLQGSGRVYGIVVLVNGLQLFFDKNIQFILKNRKKEA